MQHIRHILVTEFPTKDEDESWDSNESNDATISSEGVDGAELWTNLQVAKTHNTDDVN